MTGADVLAKDMLFATLDPTMRGVVLPSGRKVILSDTVGFISDLPTQLVAAFRATLEEVLEADLILHVRDISHPETAEQAKDVADILTSLGVKADVPMIEVWNKIDLTEGEARAALKTQAGRSETIRAISALNGDGIAGLTDLISEMLEEEKTEREVLIPFAEGRVRAWLFEQGLVISEIETDEGYRVSVRWTARQEKRFREMLHGATPE
ncbi:GTPase HflX [mine drainage metagenome]|uniref:GTPase HflX n=1 Tax=mine drainage metagenome TaxID=410659 RepID=A0A1J5PIW2_9ZZZZ